ncbi:olfactory receptor 4N5-like [Trachemys scripta elegans]|uniref:olfactory receptor 4N5-like n=1 Tax=Trachemys scripta elegans TaxID=31138 RepID=UPI001556B5AC|nr:olfactory receptor 4N5-like [Trachemys scripta elegans]
MGQENWTVVTTFVLLGLSPAREVQLILFFLFLLFYTVILPGNVLIILTVWGDPRLGSPMYFLLANLAFLDICYCSVTPPKMLADFFSRRKTISYMGCMAQIFFLHLLGAAEAFLLLTMAYDRYVAVCQPLRYTSMVSRGVCWALVGASWAGGFIHAIILVGLIAQLPFCGPNVLDNFFCDVPQVIKLACTDTALVEILTFSNNGLVILLCFLLLLVSYSLLLLKLRACAPRGQSKVASTCITHIIVVFVMFVPAIYIYCLPFRAVPLEKVVAVLHTVVFPLTNPMIYTLRNKEVKSAMRRMVGRYGSWGRELSK